MKTNLFGMDANGRMSWLQWAMLALILTSPFWSRPIGGLVSALQRSQSGEARAILGVGALAVAVPLGFLFVREARIGRPVTAFACVLPAITLVSFGVTLLLTLR